MFRATRVLAANPYAVLGVGPKATVAELKAAYRQKAIAWNPERRGMPSHERAEAEVRFKEIKGAFYDLQKKGIDLAAASPKNPLPREEEVTKKFSEEIKRATVFQRRLYSSMRTPPTSSTSANTVRIGRTVYFLKQPDFETADDEQITLGYLEQADDEKK
jgi:hypothetical protein